MRYVSRKATRPKMDWWDGYPMLEGKTVHEPEPVDTGLLDQDGNAIIRVMDPIGFIELKERG